MSSAVAMAGVVALVGIALAVAALIYLHVAPTGLSPLRNPVSQYGITAQRRGYRVATISLGAAGAATAVGIGTALRGNGVSVVVALLAVFAVARGIISWFPMDAPGSPRTSTGQTHGLIAIVTFAAATIAALRLGQILSRGGPWQGLAATSLALGWVMVVSIAGLFLTRRSADLRRYFGAIERVLYLAIIGWLSVFAVACTVRLR
jgi:hypothetical protein